MSTLKTTNIAHPSSASNNIVLDSSARVGIGSTSPQSLFVVSNGGANGLEFIPSAASGTANYVYSYNRTAADYTDLRFDAKSTRFEISGTERGRWDSSGRLLVGTSSSSATVRAVFQDNSGSTGPGHVLLATSSSVPTSAEALGRLRFSAANHVESVQIEASRDGGTWTAGSSQPSKLTFSTCPDNSATPVERLRINSGGTTICTAPSGNNVIEACSAAAVTNTRFIRFNVNTSTEVGSIQYNGSGTNYITSSDYRLKENLLPLEGAIGRVSRLPVYRFNFISNPDQVVDGFIAHEVQNVVPEAITGTKDEVDADGNPVYQGIDQSKLVPLLTAALQELVAEVESLKAKVAALEAS